MRIARIVVIAAGLAVAACSPPAAPKLWTLEQAEAPISVTVTTEASAAVSVDVPVGGKTLTATGPDGTVYELRIPADALVSPTRITMTPVRAVAGVPMSDGDVTLGVQLEPSGLTFVNPATLVITPPAGQEIPLSNQLFVDWVGAGEKLGLAMPNPASSALEVRVFHFSGYAAVRTKGLDAALEPVRRRLGGDAERRIQSAVAEKVTRLRANPTDPTAGTLAGLLEGELLEQFMHEVVRPRVAAASSGCAEARLALDTLISLERQSLLLGGDAKTEYGRLLPIAAEVCMKEEYEICRDEHVITRILPARFGIERLAALMGLVGQFSETDRYVEGCLRFELDYRSVASALARRFDTHETVKTSRLRVRLSGSVLQPHLQGTGPLISEAFTVQLPSRCDEAVDVTRVGGTFTVGKLNWLPSDDNESVQDFSLDFEPGTVGSSFRVKDVCSTPNTTSDPLMQNHTLAWTPLAPTIYQLGADGYRAEGFSVTKATKLGHLEKSGQLSMSNVTLEVRDSFDLFHAPGLN